MLAEKRPGGEHPELPAAWGAAKDVGTLAAKPRCPEELEEPDQSPATTIWPTHTQTPVKSVTIKRWMNSQDTGSCSGFERGGILIDGPPASSFGPL